jgi:hypothetical protein
LKLRDDETPKPAPPVWLSRSGRITHAAHITGLPAIAQCRS